MEMKQNALTAEIYTTLRENIGWRSFAKDRTIKALSNDLYDVVLFDEDSAVGMGRLVGDGSLCFYIQDVVVKKEYQGQGVGKQILHQLLAYIKSLLKEGEECSIYLFAALEKETFYEQFGFTTVPNTTSGAGMMIRMKKEADSHSM